MSVGNGYQLNHILKTRDLVSRNNEKLQHQHANELGGKSRDVIDPPRDQGFTRPKVNYLEPLDYYQYPEYWFLHTFSQFNSGVGCVGEQSVKYIKLPFWLAQLFQSPLNLIWKCGHTAGYHCAAQQVLVLLPLRSTALKFVKRLIELAPSSQTVNILFPSTHALSNMWFSSTCHCLVSVDMWSHLICNLSPISTGSIVTQMK
jgi:hypothetical protein